MMFKVKQYLAVVVITFLTSFVTAAELVHINTADAVTIAENLNGIGPSKAKAIVEYRELHGDFTSVDDLVKVKGIGLKLMERNSALINFGEGAMSIGSKTNGNTAATSVASPVDTGGSSSSSTIAPSN